MNVKSNENWKKRGLMIKNAREAKGLYQKDVAKILGVKNNTIAGYETGVRKVDIDTAVTLCTFLNIDLTLFCTLNRKFKSENI